MYKPVIDKIISQRADEFAQREYMSDSHERDALSKGYYWGYKDADKVCALTIADLELLHTFLYAVKNNKQGCFTFTRLSDEQYEEVLRRYNELKNESKN